LIPPICYSRLQAIRGHQKPVVGTNALLTLLLHKDRAFPASLVEQPEK